MKNLIRLFFIGALLSFSVAASAQLKSLTISAAEDTLTDAGTSYLKLTSNGFKNSISFQLKVVKIDGTVAATATLEGSHDGTTYASISSDSYTVTNVASQSHIWTVAPSSVPYYRIKLVGTGTQRCIPTATAVIR
jgi:hypothetical protein